MPTFILMMLGNDHLNVTILLIPSTRGQFEDAVTVVH